MSRFFKDYTPVRSWGKKKEHETDTSVRMRDIWTGSLLKTPVTEDMRYNSLNEADKEAQ